MKTQSNTIDSLLQNSNRFFANMQPKAKVILPVRCYTLAVGRTAKRGVGGVGSAELDAVGLLRKKRNGV
jgi:hypothetical protein